VTLWGRVMRERGRRKLGRGGARKHAGKEGVERCKRHGPEEDGCTGEEGCLVEGLECAQVASASWIEARARARARVCVCV